MICPEPSGWLPVGNDVVICLCGTGDLHEYNFSFTPITLWLDPLGGALIVAGFGILKLLECLMALQQAETQGPNFPKT